jgi:ribosomal protein L37E
MKSVSHIKCSNCGEFNTNKEYCESCNALISHKKKEESRATKVKEKEISTAIEQIEKLNFADKMRKHPFFLLKIVGWILHSVWVILNIIGGLVAWFVAMVAAG